MAPGGSTFLTLGAASSVTPGTHSFTVSGQAQVDGQTLTRSAVFTLEVLAATTPSLTGRILTAEGIPQPIPGVTVTLGAAFALTDAAGNFVLLQPPTGANMLFVDGRTASTPTAQYPIVETQVNVGGSGATRVPFVIYLPTLDTANAVTLPTDATGTVTQTVQVTTPAIPGLRVTVPAGTRIIDGNGNPVAQLVITPVPVDRSPMPFPVGVVAAMLFAINPGGAVPSQAAADHVSERAAGAAGDTGGSVLLRPDDRDVAGVGAGDGEQRRDADRAGPGAALRQRRELWRSLGILEHSA